MILLSLDSRLFSEDLCNTQRKQNCWTVQSQEELEKHHRLPDYDFRKNWGHEAVFYLDVQDGRHAVHVEVSATMATRRIIRRGEMICAAMF